MKPEEKTPTEAQQKQLEEAKKLAEATTQNTGELQKYPTTNSSGNIVWRL